MEWIDVKNKFPKQGELVLIYTGVVRLGYVLYGQWFYFHNQGEDDPFVHPDVRYWSYLPEPPQTK